jgi:hypothetical protein
MIKNDSSKVHGTSSQTCGGKLPGKNGDSDLQMV